MSGPNIIKLETIDLIEDERDGDRRARRKPMAPQLVTLEEIEPEPANRRRRKPLTLVA